MELMFVLIEGFLDVVGMKEEKVRYNFLHIYLSRLVAT